MGGHFRFDAKAGRYYVAVYWRGQRYRIWKYRDEPLWHEKTAAKLLGKIRTEVDDGTFDPRHYLPDSPLALEAYAETWLAANTSTKGTKTTHRKAIRYAMRVTGADGAVLLPPTTDIRTLTLSRLSILRNSMTCGEAWANRVMMTLRAMVRFAVRDGVMKHAPEFPPIPRYQAKPPEYLSYEDQQRVLAAIPERHRAVYAFGMEFGLRIGELRALKKDCIERGHVVIRRSFSRADLRETTKTHRVRRLPLTEKAIEILRTAPPSFGEFLFSPDGQRPYSEAKLERIWRAACAELGITIQQRCALRHSLGCQLLDQGEDLELVRDIYGHSSTDTTRIYATRTPRRILEALEKRGKVVEIEKGRKVE